MYFGEYLIDFLLKPAKNVTIYYPGIHREIVGHEIAFRNIIKEIKSKDTSLNIQTIGITTDKIYNKRSYKGNRINDFNMIEVKNLYAIYFNNTEKNILFLPQPERWTQDSDNTIDRNIKNLINRITSGGMIITDSKLPEGYMSHLYKTILHDTNVQKIQPVTSKRHGDFIVMKI